jgi:hypothetical protein
MLVAHPLFPGYALPIKAFTPHMALQHRAPAALYGHFVCRWPLDAYRFSSSTVLYQSGPLPSIGSVFDTLLRSFSPCFMWVIRHGWPPVSLDLFPGGGLN